MQNISISKTAPVNLYLKRGDFCYLNFQLQLDGIGIDFSSYDTAKMQVRETEFSNPVLSYSSSGGTINLNNLNLGQIIISGSTSNVTAGNYYYDLQLSKNNIIETVMAGAFYIDHDFTV